MSQTTLRFDFINLPEDLYKEVVSDCYVKLGLPAPEGNVFVVDFEKQPEALPVIMEALGAAMSVVISEVIADLPKEERMKVIGKVMVRQFIHQMIHEQ